MIEIRPHRGIGTFLALILFAVGTPSVSAQERPPETPVDSLRAEIQRLRVELDSIRALLERGQADEADEEDALARLRAAARRAASTAVDTTAAADDQVFVGRTRSLQALNPEISVTGDLLGVISTEDPDADNFVAREFEFSFQSALDPFTRAKIFISGHEEGAHLEFFGHEEEGDGEEEEHAEEGGHGASLAVEEGYLEWVNLPGGLSLKAGRFFQQLGQLNRWHDHALPFQTRSLPHLVYVGEEPLIQDGISARMLLPTSPGAGTYELTVEGTRSRNETLFGESTGPSLLGHFNAFWQTSRATDFELGLSAVVGDHVGHETEETYRQRLFNAEMAFNWIPPSQARYRGLTLRAGAMISDPGAPEGELDREAAIGLWAQAETKLGQQWILGGRWGQAENPADPDETAWMVSPALTYWQSEYVRLRAEYDVFGHDGETSGVFTLRFTFAMGPHKHEVY